ncbi:MAG: hypothetical protein ACT4O2_11915 [Beijerinckiaceae bacterium]
MRVCPVEEAQPIKRARDERTSVGGRSYTYKPLHAGECGEETICVACGGSVVVLESSGVHEVDPDDTPDMALWSAGDVVLLCGEAKMINKDTGGKVHVTAANRLAMDRASGMAPQPPRRAGIEEAFHIALALGRLLREKPSEFGEFWHPPAGKIVAHTAERPNQCQPISILA